MEQDKFSKIVKGMHPYGVVIENTTDKDIENVEVFNAKKNLHSVERIFTNGILEKNGVKIKGIYSEVKYQLLLGQISTQPFSVGIIALDFFGIENADKFDSLGLSYSNSLDSENNEPIKLSNPEKAVNGNNVTLFFECNGIKLDMHASVTIPMLPAKTKITLLTYPKQAEDSDFKKNVKINKTIKVRVSNTTSEQTERIVVFNGNCIIGSSGFNENGDYLIRDGDISITSLMDGMSYKDILMDIMVNPDTIIKTYLNYSEKEKEKIFCTVNTTDASGLTCSAPIIFLNDPYDRRTVYNENTDKRLWYDIVSKAPYRVDGTFSLYIESLLPNSTLDIEMCIAEPRERVPYIAPEPQPTPMELFEQKVDKLQETMDYMISAINLIGLVKLVKAEPSNEDKAK